MKTGAANKRQHQTSSSLTKQQEQEMERKMRVLANLLIDRILAKYSSKTLTSSQEAVFNEIK